MKVDRNQIFPNIELYEEGVGVFGIPIRLEIAARFIAGALADPDFNIRAGAEIEFCKKNLELADVLIHAHSLTCGDELTPQHKPGDEGEGK